MVTWGGMDKDRMAGVVLLVALAAGWILLFETLSVAAIVGLAVLLLGPFAILITFMMRGGLRTTRGWDRPKPRETPDDRAAP